MPSYGTIFLALRSAFVSEEDLGFEGALSTRHRAVGGAASVEVEPRRCPLNRTAHLGPDSIERNLEKLLENPLESPLMYTVNMGPCQNWNSGPYSMGQKTT